MCNLYTQSRSPDEIARLFAEYQIPLGFPEGVPNLEPRDIAITDPGPVVRAAAGEGPGRYELLVRRWSWPGPGGKPLYNLRSDGREFGRDRALIVADGFYEFTTPTDPKAKRKDRWLIADRDRPIIAIAALLRAQPDGSEAFTMLTTTPGPDVVPYHNRQPAVLPPSRWRAWLDHQAAATDLIGPSPEGSLTVRAAPR